MIQIRLAGTAFILGLLVWPEAAEAQAVNTTGSAVQEHLGSVHFPTTCSPEAQSSFEKGVALLHSFQYEEARQTFVEVEKRDAKCAMAHWGKAMSLYYQLWEFPDTGKLEEGHKEIEQANKQSPQSPREKGFVAAAAAFYQKNDKLSHLQRKQAYSAALEKLRTQVPGDVEVDSFYALSLVSLADEAEVDSMANLKQAIAVLQPLFQQYPDHPGVAHYLIHATDRPELANKAWRRLAGMP
jgi:hypothetical protein